MGEKLNNEVKFLLFLILIILAQTLQRLGKDLKF